MMSMKLSPGLRAAKQAVFVPPKAPVSIPWKYTPFNGTVYTDAESFYRRNLKEVPDYAQRILPPLPTDIKGVHQSLYHTLRNAELSKAYPILGENRYFALRFYPAYNVVSQVRKSTVAYMFTNKGGTMFNDENYAKKMKAYKGKYRKENYFEEKHLPLGGACTRQKYRRFLKAELHHALHKYYKNNEIGIWAGIYYFRLKIVPRSEQHEAEVRELIETAIQLLREDKTVSPLRSAAKRWTSMKRSVLEPAQKVPLGAQNVPGYYPELPFADNVTFPKPSNRKSATNWYL